MGTQLHTVLTHLTHAPRARSQDVRFSTGVLEHSICFRCIGNIWVLGFLTVHRLSRSCEVAFEGFPAKCHRPSSSLTFSRRTPSLNLTLCRSEQGSEFAPYVVTAFRLRSHAHEITTSLPAEVLHLRRYVITASLLHHVRCCSGEWYSARRTWLRFPELMLRDGMRSEDICSACSHSVA